MARQAQAALLVALALSLPALAGCIGGPDAGAGTLRDGDGTGSDWLDGAVWDTDGDYSRPLDVLGLDPLDGERIVVESHDGTPIETAIWRPDTDEPVPVVLDVGPYYGGGILDLGSREQEFFLDGFVADGYAYGRVAVRGTAQSGGCQGFFSMDEQRDIDEVVTHFGTQEWSNGNVALYGGSYDGTTPWIAASFGNPHLKTIVPTSGLTDVAGLLFPNGTSETRGPIIQSLYYTFGAAPAAFDYQTREDYVLDNACEEAVRGWEASAYTTLTGHRGVPGSEDYWAIRDWRQPVLDNYEGSVLLVHGLQDWNVEPSMAFPFVNRLADQGTDVKMMLGQWGHDWPDRADREDHVRWDWAEVLLRWFDRYLKEDTAQATGPAVDVEDNRGNWRTEATWPPADAAWTTLHLGDGALSLEPTDPGEATRAAHGTDDPVEGLTYWSFTSDPLESELRFAGLARLHATVVPHTSRGGNLYAELVDVAPDGSPEGVVAHAVMNLQYHDGGDGTQMPTALTPGEPVVARMQFFAADVVVPAGHSLELRVHPDTDAFGYMSSNHPAPITLVWGDGASTLDLPVVVRDVGDGAYPGEPVG